MGRRMYSDYFGISENAFSITPDPRYLYMSERHCEALAHLLYGVVESGCFVMLTGEVGTGKTTVCRALLEQLPDNVDVALLLDPPRSGRELLLAICDELHIALRQREAPLRELVDQLNQRLLESHAAGRRTVVIIDEAQNIRPDVLEQVRLLTNLETATEKLLHVILVGQPELRQQLAEPSLRQVSQRITARYHLQPLTLSETEDYVHHRLTVAGCRHGLFSSGALRQLHQESQGVPRVINILCDRALLGAFANDLPQVGKSEVREAAKVWRDEMRVKRPWFTWRRLVLPLSTAGLLCGAALLFVYGGGWSITAAALAVENAQPAGVVASATAQQSVPVKKSVAAPVAEVTLPAVDGAATAPKEALVSPANGAAVLPQATSSPPPTPVTETAVAEPTQAATPLLAEMALPRGMSGLVQAERALLDRWGLEPDNKEARLCSSARRNGLECLFGSGSWETLLHYNRPALLTLQQEGELRYVLLEGLDGEKATLWSDGALVTVPREVVNRYWSGDFRLLWHPRPLVFTTIGADSPPSDIHWLSEALDRYEGRKSGSEAIHFNESMRERIRRVQRNAGLMVDGIAGPYTLSHLHAPYDNSPGPRLHNHQPAS
ncbi:MAG TPA: AAA family ATPase [Gammaproteobacteria bacterium]